MIEAYVKQLSSSPII